jgi:NADH-quinone oxidoreductase subunit J
MLLSRNAVHAALFLVVNLFCIAVMYLLLEAPFLFAVQIIVYAGAIMVLFLFVIMLLGVDRGDDLREPLIGQRPLAVILAAAFVVEIAVAVRAGIGFATMAPEGFDAVNRDGNARALARVLFREYFLPFEVTSLLLIVAAVAAMVLAHRRARAVTQAELERLGLLEPPREEAPSP